MIDVDEGISLEEKRIKAADAVKIGGFKKWLEYVKKPDTPILDQPPEIIEGMKTVKVASLQGLHHWQVGALVHLDLGEYAHDKQYQGKPGLNVIEGYRSALLADMAQRPSAQMRRILTTMAETKAGRLALWGNWHGEGDPPAGGDSDFRSALAKWANSLALDKPVDLPQLLRDAYKPIAAVEDPRAQGLVSNLIAHGHYTMADILVPGAKNNPPAGDKPQTR